MAKTVALIQGAIASAIAQASQADTEQPEFTPLEHRVIGVLSERVISERADLLVKGVDLVTKMEADLGNINKPDTKFTQPDGAALELTSAKRTQEIAAAKGRLDKASAALGQALNSAQFGALEKLVKSGGKGED